LAFPIEVVGDRRLAKLRRYVMSVTVALGAWLMSLEAAPWTLHNQHMDPNKTVHVVDV
jgi:hypothetical protein